MSKTLSTIQTIFKIAKILAKIVFVFSIIGGIGCLIAILALPLLGSMLTSELSSLFIEEFGTVSFGFICFSCLTALITCIGEAIISFLAGRYFDHELKAGTPFTFEGSKELFRLGITAIIVPIAVSVLSGIFFGICLFFAPEIINVEFGMSFSIGTGLIFLLLSLIFKHGAELHEFIAYQNQFSKQQESPRPSDSAEEPKKEGPTSGPEAL